MKFTLSNVNINFIKLLTRDSPIKLSVLDLGVTVDQELYFMAYLHGHTKLLLPASSVACVVLESYSYLSLVFSQCQVSSFLGCFPPLGMGSRMCYAYYSGVISLLSINCLSPFSKAMVGLGTPLCRLLNRCRFAKWLSPKYRTLAVSEYVAQNNELFTHALSVITIILLPDKEPTYRTIRLNTRHLTTLNRRYIKLWN